MARDDGDRSWARQLLVAVGALVVVSLVIGGVVGAFALGAARVSGLGDSPDQPRASAAPSLVIPSGEPTTDVDPYPVPSASSGTPTPTPTKSAASPTPRPRAISLQVLPQQVAAGQRINLTGTYPGAEGVRLQVQRLENGGWVDFPVTVGVSGGRFATFITTSRSGDTRLRVLDQAAGKASNVARVSIG